MAVPVDSDSGLIGSLATMFGVGLFLGPVAVVGYRCYEWLRTSIWPEFSLETIMGGDRPHFEWLGVDKIVDMIWNAPIELVIVAVCWPLFSITLHISNSRYQKAEACRRELLEMANWED